MKTYIFVCFGSILMSMLLVPIISRLAKRYSLVDKPGLRKVHKSPVPRIGGIVFILSTLTFVIPVFFLNNSIGDELREIHVQFITLLAGATFIFIVGLIDDLRTLPPKVKFLCLIAASFAICLAGATIKSIEIMPGFEIELGLLSWPLAIIWICTITIGMNFIDGLDGLAGGIAAIVCSTILILALWSSQEAIAILMVALLGSIIGFLFFNFHPAKIFMGDSGSMFLGFIIGAGSLVCQAKTNTLVGLAIPFLVMGVPILDAGFTMIRRTILYRRSLFASEMGHIHHHLLNIGLPYQTVVVVIYAITIIAACFGIFMLTATSGWSIGILAGGLVFLFTVYLILGAGRIRETVDAIKRNRSISRKNKEDFGSFEDIQLKMRTANHFNSWWESVCQLAKQMQFEHVELSLNEKKNSTQYKWNTWKDDNDAPAAQIVLPLHGNDSKTISEIKIKVKRNSFLEVTCRQAALLGRLIDEFPPPKQMSDITNKKYEYSIDQQPESQVITVDERNEDISKSKLPTINVMGANVTVLDSYNNTLSIIEKRIEAGQKSVCVAVNPQKLYRAWHEEELMNVLRKADLTICDGVGISVASRILNGKSIKRVTGCDLFFELLSKASRKKWGVFLLGASPRSNIIACSNIQKIFPDLRIVGKHDGYFKDSSHVIKQINDSKADLLFVAMGSPRQEYWIWQNRHAINAAFCMGVGGSLDVASGKIKRAPKIMQRIGAEFIYQLITEPRKRWPRQKVYFPFMFKVIGKKIFGSVMLTGEEQGNLDERKLADLLQVENMKEIYKKQ